jgi:phage repressor protein C with HTH and peptisase S24 domain
MEPTLRPGETVLVDPRAPVVPGCVVLAPDPRDGRPLLKRVASLEGGLDLRGDSPSQSTDSRHFGPVDPALVEGVVVCTFP